MPENDQPSAPSEVSADSQAAREMVGNALADALRYMEKLSGSKPTEDSAGTKSGGSFTRIGEHQGPAALPSFAMPPLTIDSPAAQPPVLRPIDAVKPNGAPAPLPVDVPPTSTPRGTRGHERPVRPAAPEVQKLPEAPANNLPDSPVQAVRRPGDHRGDARYHNPKAYDNMPAPADRAPYTRDGVYLDPRLESLNVEIEPVNVKPGEQYWKVTSVEYQNNTQFTPDITESGGRLNIYYATKDAQGNPIPGAIAVQEWPDGKVRSGTDGGGGTNFPMGRGSSYFPENGSHGGYSTSIEGAPSEKVKGLGMPGGAHVSFVVTYQLATKK